MLIHFLFAIIALRSFLDRNTWGNQLFENASEKTTATHLRIIQSINSEYQTERQDWFTKDLHMVLMCVCGICLKYMTVLIQACKSM